jgi:four helix bundle protein
VQFLALAKSPAGEVGSQLYVALDQKYITIETFDQLLTIAITTNHMVAELMNYLRRHDQKNHVHNELFL